MREERQCLPAYSGMSALTTVRYSGIMIPGSIEKLGLISEDPGASSKDVVKDTMLLKWSR